MNSVATPYVLPFEAHHSSGPIFGLGGDVRVDVELTQPTDDAGIQAFDGVIIAFVQLASTGALAGLSIPPWDSKISDHLGPSRVSRTHLSWVLKACTLDEAALVILVQLFLDLHEERPILRVSVATFGSFLMQTLASQPDLETVYPRAYANVPFPWSIDDDAMDSPNVLVRFRSPPSEEQREGISNQLLTWAAATAMGAYPVAPELPRDCGVAIDPNIPIVDDELDWGLSQFRAHSDALLGLVNALAVISRDVSPIEDVRIE